VATTAADGAYRIEYLPIGKYDVQVDMAGFKKFVQQNVVLAVDQAQTLNVTLAVGASSETVTVSATPPLVETTTATLGRTVQPAEIIGLPLVNRNAYAELSLTPGCNRTAQAEPPTPATAILMAHPITRLAFPPRRWWSMAALMAVFPWSAFTWMVETT
jgi:hypothetical protein